jgi:hypothetical protein
MRHGPEGLGHPLALAHECRHLFPEHFRAALSAIFNEAVLVHVNLAVTSQENADSGRNPEQREEQS